MTSEHTVIQRFVIWGIESVVKKVQNKQREYRHSVNKAIQSKVKNWNKIFKMREGFFLAGMEALWGKGGGTVLLGDNTGRGAAMPRPIRFQFVAA